MTKQEKDKIEELIIRLEEELNFYDNEKGWSHGVDEDARYAYENEGGWRDILVDAIERLKPLITKK